MLPVKRWLRSVAILVVWGLSLIVAGDQFVTPLAKLILSGLIVVGGLLVMLRRERAPTPAAIITPEPVPEPVLTEAARFRHDLRSPLNLMLGYCEALLHPRSSAPVPAPYRSDVEAIYRSGQQLSGLIDQLVLNAAQPAPERASVDDERPLLLLDASGAAFELFSQYMSRRTVIRAASVEEIGRLGVDPAAVVISGEDDTQVALVAQLIGDNVPIFTLRFQAASQREVTYLMKPIQFDALETAVRGSGSQAREILIIDDSRDSVELLSRMLTSLPEPPRIAKAYSGREALALLREYRPDLILMDFVLPDMNGTTLLDMLNIESRLAQIPVVMISAHRPPDLMPLRSLTKLTFFQMTGVSPLKLAQQLDIFLSAFIEN
ncbi:MAG: response regulator [Chloroflexota bacterium]